jgi:hypothetical protein
MEMCDHDVDGVAFEVLERFPRGSHGLRGVPAVAQTVSHERSKFSVTIDYENGRQDFTIPAPR